MTPSAHVLIAKLREEAQTYDDIATADGSTIARQRAEAKRDTLDSLVQRLPRVLALIEAEAVEEYHGVAGAARVVRAVLAEGWTAGVSAPSTPTARLLLREFESEAADWDDVTTTDAPHLMRQRAEARRDAIDWAIARLRSALPVIEDEAAQEERGTAEWLEAGAGVPA